MLYRPYYCDEHNTGKKLKLYCETCDKPICRDCILDQHSEHHYVYLKQSNIEKHKAMISQALTQTKLDVSLVDVGLQSVQDVLDKIDSSAKKANDEISQYFQAIIQQMLDRQKVLQAQVEQLRQSKQKPFLEQKETLQGYFAPRNHSVTLIDSVLQYGSELQILMMKKISMKRLRVLNDQFNQAKLNLDARPVDDIRFSVTDTGILTAAINTLGQVKGVDVSLSSSSSVPSSASSSSFAVTSPMSTAQRAMALNRTRSGSSVQREESAKKGILKRESGTSNIMTNNDTEQNSASSSDSEKATWP